MSAVRTYPKGSFRQKSSTGGFISGIFTNSGLEKKAAIEAQKKIEERHARKAQPSKKPRTNVSPYSDELVLEILLKWKDGYKLSALAEKYQIPAHTLYQWSRGTNRAHVLEQADEIFRSTFPHRVGPVRKPPVVV